MKNKLIVLFSIVAIFSSCIKDDIIEDFVEPTLRITTTPDTIIVSSTYQFEFMYLNNVGQEESVDATWSSSNVLIINIDNLGLANANTEGNVDIAVEYVNDGIQLSDVINVNVGQSNVESNSEKSGTINTTSSYALEGNFTLNENGDNLVLEFADDYKASTALPGLFVYLSNNRNSIADALEVSAVETFSGAHSYNIENVGINDFKFLLYFCKPFNVKVGDGEIE